MAAKQPYILCSPYGAITIRCCAMPKFPIAIARAFVYDHPMTKGLYRTKAADPIRQALIFQLESGADVFVTEEDMRAGNAAVKTEEQRPAEITTLEPKAPMNRAPSVTTIIHKPNNSAQWVEESRKLALAAQDLEQLRQAIMDFEGLEVKTTATNMVFADGNPAARVMVVGEAPGADEDMQGKPFVGRSGQLLDKIMLAAGLSRDSKDINTSIYISNVLNWRPPGNRTPTAQEMDIARPFIEKHIALINPDILLFAGAVAAQTLLAGAPTLAKARGKWHDYKPLTDGIDVQKPIAAYALYHPAYLMRSPLQKKKAWHDMLAVAERVEGLVRV